MKLYLSGPIATEPNFKVLFDKDARWLRDVGYEVVNPVEVQPDCVVRYRGMEQKWGDCLEQSGHSPAMEGDFHSWQCYLRWDIAAMMTCDGVAVQQGHLNSRGAMLECYLAMQVGMPIKTVREWAAAAIREKISGLLHSGEVKQVDSKRVLCQSHGPSCEGNTSTCSFFAA